jgi:hypothetical protein
VRIIFSRNRPAQLDLLLRSIERHMEPAETHIIWHGSSRDFRAGYRRVVSNPMQEEGAFADELRAVVNRAREPVTFFCDDDIVFRKVEGDPAEALDDQRVLAHSLCLGRGNRQMRLPDGFPVWDWTALRRHDFGYPCGIDGNTYRPKDVRVVLPGDDITNPTWFETMFHMRLRYLYHRPLMASFQEQSVVGVPVNITSPSSSVAAGLRFEQSAKMLNERFLDGERINLDALDFSGVKSVHQEFPFEWEPCA